MKKSGDAVKSILIVEDEKPISDLCWRVLSSQGLEVHVASNGKVAQDMIKKRQFDILLLDVRMPIMNGIGLYGWLKKKRPQLANCVIFITGSVIGQETTKFLTETGRPFLLKPFTTDELIAVLRKF